MFVASLLGVAGQNNAKGRPENAMSSGCTPKLVNDRQRGADMRKQMEKPIRIRKRDKPTGRIPVVALEILETGEVTNLRIKQTSGIADEDAHALQWVGAFRCNNRPGCGVIESEVGVTIDLIP